MYYIKPALLETLTNRLENIIKYENKEENTVNFIKKNVDNGEWKLDPQDDILSVLKKYTPNDLAKVILKYSPKYNIIEVKTNTGVVEMLLGPIPKNGIPCSRCEQKMFAIETPDGADYNTCPLCGMPESESDEDVEREYYFCGDCGIVFDLAGTHAMNGCTDNIYYAEIVESITIDNCTIEGMPRFKTIDDYVKAENIVKFNMKDTSPNAEYCKKASYSER